MDPEDVISIDGAALRDGVNTDTVSARPIDTSEADERALQEYYDKLRSYFQARSRTGFRWSAFYGYDLHGVLGAWQYCYAINYLREFEPDRSYELDEANLNFFNQPPLALHENVSQYFIAPIVDGQTPALWAYDRL